jgi:hypothetical protein
VGVRKTRWLDWTWTFSEQLIWLRNGRGRMEEVPHRDLTVIVLASVVWYGYFCKFCRLLSYRCRCHVAAVSQYIGSYHSYVFSDIFSRVNKAYIYLGQDSTLSLRHGVSRAFNLNIGAVTRY